MRSLLTSLSTHAPSHQSQGLSKTLLMLGIAFSLGACAPMAATFQDGSGVNAKSGDVTPVVTDPLSCLDNKNDFELAAQVDRFEMSGGGGANSGFNPGGLLQLIGLTFNYDSGTLNTSMNLYQAFKSRSAIANASGANLLQKFTFGINFVAGLFNGGFNFYSTTPIYDLSMGALKDNFANLLSSVTNVQDPWSTNIVSVISPTEFLLPVGKNAGLMVGDQLKVLAATYDWVGTPCQSDLRMIRLPDAPIAIATVKTTQFDSAYLVVNGLPTTSTTSTTPPIPSTGLQNHAYVTISKLVNVGHSGSRKDLARSVHISSVSSPQLSFKTDSGVQTVDLTPLLKQQIKLILQDPSLSSQFYLRD